MLSFTRWRFVVSVSRGSVVRCLQKCHCHSRSTLESNSSGKYRMTPYHSAHRFDHTQAAFYRVLSIEPADWPKLHDMFKACGATTRSHATASQGFCLLFVRVFKTKCLFVCTMTFVWTNNHTISAYSSVP